VIPSHTFEAGQTYNISVTVSTDPLESSLRSVTAHVIVHVLYQDLLPVIDGGMGLVTSNLLYCVTAVHRIAC